MSLHTLVQVAQALLFAALAVYGVLAQRPSLVMLGIGLLVGLATINILEPEGGTALRRSIAGYGLGAVVVAGGLLLIYVGGH